MGKAGRDMAFYPKQKTNDDRPKGQIAKAKLAAYPDEDGVPFYVRYSLNSLNGGYIGDNIGNYYREY